LVSVVIFPFSSLILLIQVFSFLLLVNLATVLLSLVIFSKNQVFVLLIHCIVFWVSKSLISALIFIISFCLLLSGLSHSCFSRTLKCVIKLFIWDLPSFLMWALMAIKFPLKTALLHPTSSNNLCPHFHLLLRIS
jgi:hypothetical protein